MGIDPELLKQLIESFSSELDEYTVAINNSLLLLEKNNLSSEERAKHLATIFRSAHNIKGTSRSLGINTVGEIAHRVESLFSYIQKDKIEFSSEIVTLCLEAVDMLKTAFNCYIKNSELPSTLETLIERLDNVQKSEFKSRKIIEKNKIDVPNINKNSSIQHDTHEHDSIRVAISRIEKVSTLLEEIQVNKIAITDYYKDLTELLNCTNSFEYLWKQICTITKNPSENDFSDSTQRVLFSGNDTFKRIQQLTQTIHRNIRDRVNELSILSHSLQDEVRTLRMIPIGNLLCTFPRYIRDLEQSLGKKINLTIVGEDVKIDRAVLDQLKDPLIHLLRNAIDHGIESADIRLDQGKPETGQVRIKIQEEDGQIKIEIFDDGKGIDINAIEKAALNKKLFSKDEFSKLSNTQKLDLIFHSGFTTKEIITDVSGRGIGLDVVRANIENLKGKIDISTTPGVSTTFTISVPLTIATERGLHIQCGNESFVIPSLSVEKVLLIRTDQLKHIQGKQVIVQDNHTIPIYSLAELLNIPTENSIKKDQLSIVIVKKGSQAIALLVDDIIGEREIVLKPFHQPFSHYKSVAGGTLLESKQVVIVLEPNTLISEALKQKHSHQIVATSPTENTVERPHILVVDDSITTRTLEKNVLESKNYQVTVAVNGKDAWDLLQKQKFSLLITDVMMPIMDGFTLTERVKQSDSLKDLPVIIVTSLGSESEKKRGIDVGADAYIVKNEFESGTLLNIVSQFV